MTDGDLWPVSEIRQQFPALARKVAEQPAIFLDGPAGSQVPQTVAAAVSRYLLQHNANRGGLFASAKESDAVLDDAHATLAAFVGTEDPGEICFGANMTTLTFQTSRALARQWTAGDEIIVCRSDHDANFTPWILAACDAGVGVKFIELHADTTLDLQSLRDNLSPRTRLVAVGLAGNATGTIHPVAEITRMAHACGALVYVDAVHFAAHGSINVRQLGCDFLVCSAYKFFGPHVGILWGQREFLESAEPYKLRPAPDDLPGRWMTGTQCHEGIAGAAAAVRYIASLAGPRQGSVNSTLEARLNLAWQRIVAYEQTLSARLLNGLQSIPGLTVHGIQDIERLSNRVPTFSVTVRNRDPQQLAQRLAADGIFVWAGNHYAQPYTEAAGLEPMGTLRLGALHYNTTDEIDRVTDVLRQQAS